MKNKATKILSMGGINMKDIKNYKTPDFDVTIYDVEDLITANASVVGGVDFGEGDPNEGGDWFG